MNSEQEKKSAILHYWYISDIKGKRKAHGNVSGHDFLDNGTNIVTTLIDDISVDLKNADAVITTKNTVYNCPLGYCDFDKQDNYPYVIPDYSSVRESYKNKIVYPEIEPGKILLVLSNFNEYYFHSLCVKDSNGEKYKYNYRIHLGMIQDSVLISLEDDKPTTPFVNISYFPFPDSIDFYHTRLAGLPLFAENTGSMELKVRVSGKSYSIRPNERIQIF